MTSEKTKTSAPVVKEFKPKPLSPFVTDPYNTRGGKGKKGGMLPSNVGGVKGKQTIAAPKRKGGSGGDR